MAGLKFARTFYFAPQIIWAPPSDTFSLHSFIVDQWSPCSASCGEGIRFRKVQDHHCLHHHHRHHGHHCHHHHHDGFPKVECKIFLEFSKTVASLPDKVFNDNSDSNDMNDNNDNINDTIKACLTRNARAWSRQRLTSAWRNLPAVGTLKYSPIRSVSYCLMRRRTILIVQVNIVGETLQSMDGPEMLPLIADQSEKEASYNHHLIEKPVNSSSSLNTQAFITSLKNL